MKTWMLACGMGLAALQVPAQTLDLEGVSLRKVEEIEVPEGYSIGPGQLSPDGLALYFSVRKEGEDDQAFPAMMTRSALGQSFGGFKLLKIKTKGFDYLTQPAVSPDGKTIVFVSSYGNSWDNNDLVVGTLKGKKVTNLQEAYGVNSGKADAYPSLAKNGTRLYYINDIDVAVASWIDDEGFGDPFPVMEAASIDQDDIIAAWISQDEKTLVLSDGSTLYWTQRDQVSDQFPTPKAFYDGFSESGDFVGMISFSPDGKEMCAYLSLSDYTTIRRYKIQ